MTTPLTNWPTFADSKNSELLAALKKWGENRSGRADRVEQHLVQHGELLAHDPADAEQRLGDRGQPRKARDEFADPRLVSTATDDAYFQTEIAQRAAQIRLDVQQLALKQLAAGQQYALFLGNQRLHMHWLEQADRIICAIPRASFRSVLLICCAVSKAFMCRVSTQITG